MNKIICKEFDEKFLSETTKIEVIAEMLIAQHKISIGSCLESYIASEREYGVRSMMGRVIRRCESHQWTIKEQPC